MNYLVIDYETRSKADLKKVGGWEYAQDPSTNILCIGWKFGKLHELKDAPAKVWSPVFASPYGEFKRALLDPTVKVVAHNAFFERVITKFVLPKLVHDFQTFHVEVPRWICTASLSRALAIPGNLEGAAQVAGLKHQKDAEGHKLMLKMSKPRKATKNNVREWHANVNDLKRLMEYCARDVDAEAELLVRLLQLNEMERKVWELDQKINWRGFRVDRELGAAAEVLIAEEIFNLDQETVEITGGELRSTTQREAVLEYMAKLGVILPDLTAKTVADTLAGRSKNETRHRLLEIRQMVSKSSTAKYDAFMRRSASDGRIHDSMVYHGASTGRWAGAGVQPQNFPRGKIKITEHTIQTIKERDLEMLRLLYGNPMDVLSSALRGMIVPTEGYELFCADYAAIEARVLFWLAGHAEGLAAFRDSRPIYEEMAAKIYSKSLLEVTKDEREIGKRAILGCGYGMGHKKFRQTGIDLGGVDVGEPLARAAVETYRSLHAPVPLFWRSMERMAIAATRARSKVFTVGRLEWVADTEYLWCVLPSGRRLAYKAPEIRYEPTPWGEQTPRLYHGGVNSLSKKWEIAGTYGGKLVENATQAVARDLMVEAMLRIEAAGFDILISVHDEILAEAPFETKLLKEFLALMGETPDWGEGCPVKVEGWLGNRYRK